MAGLFATAWTGFLIFRGIKHRPARWDAISLNTEGLKVSRSIMYRGSRILPHTMRFNPGP